MNRERAFGRRGKRADGFDAAVVSLRAERHEGRDRQAARWSPFPLPVQVVFFFVVIFAVVTGVDRLGFIDLVGHTSAASERAGVAGPALTPFTGSLPLCSGSNYADRELTCILDGDTRWLHGLKWRMIAVDAPEIGSPECADEKRIGDKSRDRLRALMSGGYSVVRDGADKYGRTPVTITLADGRDVGEVLMEEGLAQAWPNSGNRWCGR